MKRLESTPAELDAAICRGDADPCRWVYAAPHWDADHHRWAERIPPHAVIAALHTEVDALRAGVEAVADQDPLPFLPGEVPT